jgi:hypothetical protein
MTLSDRACVGSRCLFGCAQRGFPRRELVNHEESSAKLGARLTLRCLPGLFGGEMQRTRGEGCREVFFRLHSDEGAQLRVGCAIGYS